MPYKYYTSVTSGSPSNTLVTGFQALLSQLFEVASDYFVIQEEVTLGSNVFTDIGVRVVSAVQSPLGEKLGDDYKTLSFKNTNQNLFLGKKFFFDNNYWLCVFTESIKNLASSCMIRRCNNRLKWMSETGVYQEEHCIMEYKVGRARDIPSKSDPVMPAGYIDIYAQLNNKTKNIKGNRRFLFGPPNNRVAFKVYGEGVRAYINQQTLDDSSANLLLLSLGGNYVNENTDNLVEGIADYYLDYDNLSSGSNIGSLDIVVSPSVNYLLQSGSSIYDVRYFSGSTALSGSFVFSISGSQVPVAHYSFVPLSGSSFFLLNLETYMDHTLDILCSGSSGSRLLNFDLKGAW